MAKGYKLVESDDLRKQSLNINLNSPSMIILVKVCLASGRGEKTIKKVRFRRGGKPKITVPGN